MFYHGSPVLMEVGTELLTGDQLGVSTNGGRSDGIYCTGDFGFSMSNLEDDFGCSNIREYAIEYATFWAGSSGYVYAVDATVQSYDAHVDVAPCSYIVHSGAKILARWSVTDLDIASIVSWARSYKSAPSLNLEKYPNLDVALA